MPQPHQDVILQENQLRIKSVDYQLFKENYPMLINSIL
jgi:hypothetical protein